MVLWLTLVLEMPHPQARIYSLLFFIPSAVIASLFRWRSGNLNFKKILPKLLIMLFVVVSCSFFVVAMLLVRRSIRGELLQAKKKKPNDSVKARKEEAKTL